MKNKLVLIIFGLFLIFSCKEYKIDEIPLQGSDLFFNGEHKLLNLYDTKEITTLSKKSSSGAVFLFIGSYSSLSTTETTEQDFVYFWWENYKKEYVMAKLPKNKIRLQFSEEDKAICRFRWFLTPAFNESEWTSAVIYVLIIINKKYVIGANEYKLNL
jgi:hypothetical protein